ncbi:MULTISPECIES: hypothetical protein [unclassified Xanthomonas]|uniref:hypothetical protein n=1 Tax=unclassified Xanthomonas TaxID=2643310 RepID=UPI00288BCD0D|nr:MULTISPECIES: hypothetical protein [unclassified Xanthomonas]
MQTTYGLSARRADRVLQLSRSARHYRPRQRDDGPLIAAIEAHLKDNPGHGFGMLMDWEDVAPSTSTMTSIANR